MFIEASAARGQQKKAILARAIRIVEQRKQIARWSRIETFYHLHSEAQERKVPLLRTGFAVQTSAVLPGMVYRQGQKLPYGCMNA
jgi:hypothetical protein